MGNGALASLFAKKNSGKLGEESGPPVVMVEEAFERPVLQGPGGVEGLHRGEASSGISGDFALSRVGGAQRTGKGSWDRGPGDTGPQLGKEAPGAVEQEKGQLGVRGAEGRSPDFKKNKSGGVKGKSRGGHEEAKVLTAAQGLKGALGFTLLGVTDDDVRSHLRLGEATGAQQGG